MFVVLLPMANGFGSAPIMEGCRRVSHFCVHEGATRPSSSSIGTLTWENYQVSAAFGIASALHGRMHSQTTRGRCEVSLISTVLNSSGSEQQVLAPD